MIKGYFDNNRYFINITLKSSFGVQEVVALIDTGFNGYIKVSNEKAEELGLIVSNIRNVLLADSKEIAMPASLVDVSIENITETLDVLIHGDEVIIGVGLLRRFEYILSIDFKYNMVTLARSA